MTSKLRGQIQL